MQVDGQNLTEIINKEHTNQKYLPNVALPENVVATPSVEEAAKDATLLVFVLPHQVSTSWTLTVVHPEHLQGAQGQPVAERSGDFHDQGCRRARGQDQHFR